MLNISTSPKTVYITLCHNKFTTNFQKAVNEQSHLTNYGIIVSRI